MLGDGTVVNRDTSLLDEAYARLHRTGPEFQGWLSNHGPMAVEALVRHGHGPSVHGWLDAYVRRLEDFPRGLRPIRDEDWPEALGDARRIADWTSYFQYRVIEAPWRVVLNTWWPRLLPGLTAAATHGVIRVGHAVRSLLTDGDSPARHAELAHALAYWAARWSPVAGLDVALSGHTLQPPARSADTPTSVLIHDALAKIPLLSRRTGGIVERLDRLGRMEAWPSLLVPPALPATPDAVEGWLAELIDEAVVRYLQYGQGDEIMLVHSVTAPTAVLRTLPALHRRLWAPSARAAWAATAALTSIYGTATPAPPEILPHPATRSAADAFARAVDHGDEHVIKFADAALDSYVRTGDDQALLAIFRAAELIEN